MKKILAVLLLAVCTLTAVAQMRRNTAYLNYISQYKDLAIEQMLRYRVPASITLAQGLLESRAGLSDLAVRGNNHFGIKCHGWTGRKTYHDDDEAGECFRAYDNARQSYEDHSRFLSQNSRYARLFSLDRTDYRGWAKGLKACGYATNPNYANSLIGIIETYGLSQYDRANTYDRFLERHTADTPARPGETLHQIYSYNDNYYVVAREGDTYTSIAKEVGLSARKIAKYNERNKKDTLSPGEYVYLKKKRKKAEKKYKKRPHIVRAGESLYSIAQYYGVRTKSLYKKNNLSPDYQLRVGDRIKVY